MCRSVCLIIIAYIEADDSSIMPNDTETARTNAETVHLVLNTAQLTVSDALPEHTM